MNEYRLFYVKKERKDIGSFYFLVDKRNDKANINSHTQVEVPGFEPRSWHPA